ncbi:UDP-N-acetylmuramoyl-L-alanyl-D-glutamate--2,6-diaminopimelate ligase [Kingella oralis]|uniref:UDP-N-acetylmuramoyl-L-alanyl-D-glutamate--2, 6-diaminopimelate ligase n=1 Tax=Kingella oralis TaxID=505 RepID=UPI0034E44CC0
MFSQKAAPAQPVLPALQHTVSGCQMLHADSRKIQPDDVFIACQGEYADGRNYIADAIARGASFVYWDDDGAFQWQPAWRVPNQGIRDLKQRAGMLAAQAYGNLSGSLKIIGVTGTNGKTSITQWLAQAIDDLEHTPSCAIIGTVGNGFFGELQATTHTTPDPVAVQTLIHQFKQQGARSIAMEVSSHGLAQYRVNGVPFHTAVFTNLTRDHLDYHGSMAEYGAAKERLFYWQGLQNAIINSDDAFGAALAAELKQHSGSLKTEGCNEVKTYTYGFNEQADIRITRFAANREGMSISLATPWGEGSAQTRLLGRFNAQNFAAALGALCATGYDFQAALTALSRIRPAAGRMDCIIQPDKPLVVVDYAHTPDALEKALTTLREIKQPAGSLWCVFGCGGDRDRGKRPLMGEVAARLADKAVVTSDNPRTEEPQAIIADILPAVPHPALVEADRKAAIEQAIAQAAPDDIILIAGKGHETYQEIHGVRTHFSDFEVAQDALGQW